MNLSHRIRQTKEGIYVIDGDSHITKWTEEQGKLVTDPTVYRLLEFIPIGGVVVDAGASIADHTHAYGEAVGPHGTVFAFEPNPAPFCCMTMNCRSMPQVMPFRTGLSDTFGHAGFVIDDQNLGASMTQLIGPDEIRVMPLDDLIEWFMQLKRFDFFKLDIEGMELRALMGAAHLIKYFKPVIYCEVNKPVMAVHGFTVDQLFELLHGWGYHIENFDLGKAQNFGADQFDILCRAR